MLLVWLSGALRALVLFKYKKKKVKKYQWVVCVKKTTEKHEDAATVAFCLSDKRNLIWRES